MLTGGRQRRSGWLRLFQAACASYALAAQVALLVAPLADRGHPEPAAVAIASAGGINAIHADRGHVAEHNPTTCPACVAQSVHASVQAAPAPLAGDAGRVARVDVPELLAPSSVSLALPRSRAPPVLS
jgi:hypothetical protein